MRTPAFRSRGERTVKLPAVIVLGMVMLLAAFVDVASAQRIERVAIWPHEPLI